MSAVSLFGILIRTLYPAFIASGAACGTSCVDLQEKEAAEQEAKQKEADIALGNPLVGAGAASGFSVKRRYALWADVDLILHILCQFLRSNRLACQLACGLTSLQVVPCPLSYVPGYWNHLLGILPLDKVKRVTFTGSCASL